MKEFVPDAALRQRSRLAVGRLGLGLLGFAGEVFVILAASVATGVGYHLWAYGDHGPLGHYLGVGGFAALVFTLPFLLAQDGGVQDLLEGRRSAGRIFLVWNYAFLCLGAAAFLTQTTLEFSRGWLLSLYVLGLASIIAYEAAFRLMLGRLLSAGRVATRRLMLVGAPDEIGAFAVDAAMRTAGARVVATVALPNSADNTCIAASLRVAASRARELNVDDVVILTDWARTSLMHKVVEAFTALPVSIHLGASSLIGRFSEARVSRFASLTTLSLTAPPLGLMQALAKRGLDILVAGMALVLFSPVLLVTAALIRLDSRGPVFFKQRRRGYNQTEFQIWKFRTMSTMDDGEEIRQATALDERVTRVGRYLRRTSLDELPQLFNVLKGEMSLVGPRPHALAHDRHFESCIAAYSRRLNVQPGITGWAQVNGLRGITDTVDAMRQRVDYDLYYIDNWSIAFDLYILALTVLSPKVFRNAN